MYFHVVVFIISYGKTCVIIFSRPATIRQDLIAIILWDLSDIKEFFV